MTDLMEFINKDKCDVCDKLAEDVLIVMEIDERMDLCSEHYNLIGTAWRSWRRSTKEKEVPIEDVRQQFEMIRSTGGGYY